VLHIHDRLRCPATRDFRLIIIRRAVFAPFVFVALLAPLAIEQDCLGKVVFSNFRQRHIQAQLEFE